MTCHRCGTDEGPHYPLPEVVLRHTGTVCSDCLKDTDEVVDV